MRGRRLLAAVVALAVVVAGAAGALWWLRRGDPPADVATAYLRAQWEGDARTQCATSAPPWQHVLFNGYPFADCAAFARAAAKAEEADSLDAGGGAGDGGAPGVPLADFPRYRADTRVSVDVVEESADDDRARISYLVRLTYAGPDRAGFDALWQGGPAQDRGSIEMVRVDGAWRVGGVDRG